MLVCCVKSGLRGPFLFLPSSGTCTVLLSTNLGIAFRKAVKSIRLVDFVIAKPLKKMPKVRAEDPLGWVTS